MIALLELLELLAVVTLLVVGVSQVVIPLLRNQRTFPAFRKVGKLQGKLGEATEDVEAARLEREVVRTRREATRLAPKSKDPKNP